MQDDPAKPNSPLAGGRPARPAVSVMVVEDEEKLRSFIRRNLEARGFEVTLASNGLEALGLFDQTAPNLLILDVMMPQMDGFEVCRRVRERSTVPIIMLTALDDQADRVKALDLGADDFVSKPFGVDELLARVRAVLRRSVWTQSPPPADVIRFGDLELRPSEGRMTQGGQEVRLTPTEFELLKTLASSPGRVFTHRELLVRVWGVEYSHETEYLRVYINRLRRKIEANPAQPRHLLTESGLGYRFDR